MTPPRRPIHGTAASALAEASGAAIGPNVEALLAELVSDITTVLGTKVLGIYLYGSAVSGGFDPRISDLDLLAVLASDPAPADLAALDGMHRDFVGRHPDWDDRIDTIYVSVESLRAPGMRAGPLAVVSPGEPFHVTVADDKWLMNWYLVRETGRTLHGPEPSSIIPPITEERFVANVQQHAQAWTAWIDGMQGRGAYAYAVLTLCRALYSYRTGRSTSKAEAAIWAAARLPGWSDVIQDALRWRLARGTGDSDGGMRDEVGGTADRDDGDAAAGAETRAFVEHVIALIPPPASR